MRDPDEERSGKVGRDHPATSKDAAVRARPGFATERALVLDYIASKGDDGATAAEVADALGRSRNQIATRCGELRETGWVEYLIARDENGRPVFAQNGKPILVSRTTSISSSTRGLVQRLRPEAEADYGRWRMDRIRFETGQS